MRDDAARRRTASRVILLPLVFLTVALLGGMRVTPDRAFVFLPPPLITLVMAALLASLFLRGRLVRLDAWLGSRHGVLVNVSHALTLIALFFASAQAFNSVLPEQGLLHWMFAFFFLWTLWNDQFSAFDPRRLLRSLGVLFGTAFVLKHMIMAGLSAPGGSWTRRLAGMVFEGLSLGTLDVPAVAPATGYISFFTLALYVIGLALVAPTPDEPGEVRLLLREASRLGPTERRALREALEEERS
ncbi:MAG: hypothetical protein DMF81_08300 [Acidobacteria bacterium]|nr:MAG: hypothetical protein DMF81_08300 [Acidobacteriota bacterium]